MINYTKPTDQQIAPALESFKLESSPCSCIKMPSYQDGLTIQKLSTTPVDQYIFDSARNQAIRIDEPSLALPVLCVLGVSLVIKWLAG
jgi:hypothetical protein